MSSSTHRRQHDRVTPTKPSKPLTTSTTTSSDNLHTSKSARSLPKTGGSSRVVVRARRHPSALSLAPHAHQHYKRSPHRGLVPVTPTRISSRSDTDTSSSYNNNNTTTTTTTTTASSAENMTTSFLQYCATCERQILVPDSSILYCSEHCRRMDGLDTMPGAPSYPPTSLPLIPSSTPKYKPLAMLQPGMLGKHSAMARYMTRGWDSTSAGIIEGAECGCACECKSSDESSVDEHGGSDSSEGEESVEEEEEEEEESDGPETPSAVSFSRSASSEDGSECSLVMKVPGKPSRAKVSSRGAPLPAKSKPVKECTPTKQISPTKQTSPTGQKEEVKRGQGEGEKRKKSRPSSLLLSYSTDTKKSSASITTTTTELKPTTESKSSWRRADGTRRSKNADAHVHADADADAKPEGARLTQGNRGHSEAEMYLAQFSANTRRP